MTEKNYFPKLQDISKAKITLAEVVTPTPLNKDMHLSNKYGADVLLKREDLQIVRSYKIRGAYNKIKSLKKEELANGVVCASAGNHAQGVTLSCKMLNIKGSIFMPTTTPKQKIEQVKMFGNGCIEIIIEGDTFDDSNRQAIEYAKRENKTFIPPFNDPKIIEGQATIGMEIMQEVKQKVDYIFIPIGGGGLASGIGSYFKQISPDTKIIGVEPAGAAGMKLSLEKGEVTALEKVDKFVDGAAVQRVGELTFNICKEVLDDIIVVPEGAICTTILELYNKSAMVVEPAGALSVSALRFYADKIKGKNVVCIISGSNNDITRIFEQNGMDFKSAIFVKSVSCDLKAVTPSKYDMIVLYNPSDVKSLFENFPDFKQEGIRFVSYGKSVVKAMADAGLDIEISAPTSAAPSVAKAIELYLEKSK